MFIYHRIRFLFLSSRIRHFKAYAGLRFSFKRLPEIPRTLQPVSGCPRLLVFTHSVCTIFPSLPVCRILLNRTLRFSGTSVSFESCSLYPINTRSPQRCSYSVWQLKYFYHCFNQSSYDFKCAPMDRA
jgi:hypothetical protein